MPRDTTMPQPVRQPRPFMGRPKFVADSRTVSRPKRIGIQLDHLWSLLDETPYVELPVESWYEVSGSFLALNALLTLEERDVTWQIVTDFRRGGRSYKSLTRLAAAFHAFDSLKAPNYRRWMRETGGHAKRWIKIKSDPDTLAKKRASSAASQRRRRARLRDEARQALAEERRQQEAALQQQVSEQVDEGLEAAE